MKRFFNILFKIILILTIAICGVVIFFNVTHIYYQVKGPSMAPTLNSGVEGQETVKDYVFVSKIKGYGRGDIIVLKKEDENKDIIKRVIAVGGDKLKIENINGYNRIVIIFAGESQSRVLDEPYLPSYDANEYILDYFNGLLNNESLNINADENGFVTIPENEIFFLGDNRSRSDDSLDSNFTAPVSNVVGKVDYIVYGGENPIWQVISQIFGGGK